MEQLDRFEKLLRVYSYQSLPPDEKEWVSQFVSSEEEYESLRRVTMETDKHFTPGDLSPEPEQLRVLQRQWKAVHEPAPRGWSAQWSIPAYAALLALMLVGGAGWYIGLSTSNRQPGERLVTRIDTVTVTLRSLPDTVVVERVIYRNVPVPVPMTVSTKEEVKSGQIKGVNMKEKEELEKLMVTGR